MDKPKKTRRTPAQIAACELALKVSGLSSDDLHYFATELRASYPRATANILAVLNSKSPNELPREARAL